MLKIIGTVSSLVVTQEVACHVGNSGDNEKTSVGCCLSLVILLLFCPLKKQLTDLINGNRVESRHSEGQSTGRKSRKQIV